MSDPGVRVFVLDDGRRAKVPLQSVDAWMQRMEQRGVKFHSEGAPGLDRDAQPADALAQLADFGRGAYETIHDGAVGANQGMTYGAADEAVGMLPGNSIAQQQEQRRTAQKRSPYAYNISHAAGSLVPIGLAARGAGAIAQLAQAAIQGGADAFFGDDGDIGQRSETGMKGMGAGAALYGLTKGLGEGAGWVEDKFRNKVTSKAADKAQAAATGMTGATYRNIAEDHGIDFIDKDVSQYAQQNFPHSVPKTSRWYADQAKPLKERTGQAVGEAVDAATFEVPSAMRTEDLLSQLAAKKTASPLSKADAQDSSSIDEMVGFVEQKYGAQEYLSPRDLQTIKESWQRMGYPNNATKGTSEGREQVLYQDASRIPRQGLRTAILGDAENPGLALPETQRAFDSSTRDYALADAIADASRKKSIADSAPGNNPLVMGVKSAIGALGGDYVPDAAAMALRSPAMSGVGTLGGAVAGYESGGFPGMAMGAAMGGAGSAFLRGPMRSMPGSAAGQMGGDAIAELANQDPQHRAQQQKQERERASRAGKGQDLEKVARWAMQNQPELLGPYAQKFAEADAQKDPFAVSALITALNDDKQWRATHLPQLLKLTNPSGDGDF